MIELSDQNKLTSASALKLVTQIQVISHLFELENTNSFLAINTVTESNT